MGKEYTEIDERLEAWIERQKLFFVATAPSGDAGYVNCSPKGLDTLRVLGPRRLAYLDLTGSGVETVAHLRDNGRIVVMLCAFEGPPRILRLHGRGKVTELGEPAFDALAAAFPALPGARAVIEIDVTRIADSCGYGVPRYEYLDERPSLANWANQKGEDGLDDYRRANNRTSLDGLPGFEGDG